MCNTKKLHFYSGTFLISSFALAAVVALKIPQGLWSLLISASMVTARIFIVSILCGIFIAIVLTCLPRYGLVAISTNLLIHISRCTPIVCALLIIYWLPSLIGISISNEVCAIITISLIEGCSLAYIIRNIRFNIWDSFYASCFILGLSRGMTFRKVVVPLLITLTIPHAYNFILFVISASALSSFIGIVEMTQATKILATTLFDPVSTYSIMFLFFLCMNSLTLFLANLTETFFDKNRIITETGINYE